MALSKPTSDDEIDIKVHYQYYGEDRCTVISMEVRELLSLGYDGLESIIKGHVQYLGRMPLLRMSYKDEQNDYVDLCDYNFNRFIRVIRNSKAVSGIPLTNIRVVEGISPFTKGKTPQFSTQPSCRGGTDPPACKGLDFTVKNVTPSSATKDAMSGDLRYPCENSNSMVLTDLEFKEEDDEKDFLDSFTYKSPFDHSLDSKKEDIDSINTKILSAKDYLLTLKAKYQNSFNNGGRGKQCSNCHLRLDHTVRQCRLEKCESAEQCGDVMKHPDERKLIDEADDQVRKLEKELKAKNTEYVSLSKAAAFANDSFPQRVRAHLINSNKKKYLLQTRDGLFVPKSCLVNCDFAKLEKFYNRKVPDDIEGASKSFQQIIENFDRGISSSSKRLLNPARPLLENNDIFPVKFPRSNLQASCTQTQFDKGPDDLVHVFPLKKRF